MGDAVADGDRPLLERAEAAVARSREDPRAAIADAEAVLTDADAHDGEAVAVALRARAMAERELGELALARRSLETAVGAGRSARARRATGLARGTLASVLAAGGDLEGALGELAAAARLVDGADRALVEMQRADVLGRLGRTAAASRAFASAEAAAVDAGDATAEGLVHANRAIVDTYAGRLDRAEDGLARAETLFRGAGLDLFAADVHHNRGFVAGRRGDVVTALTRFEEARTEHDRLGVSRPNGWLDEVEVLLSVRLAPEARALAERAERALASGGSLADAAEAQLALAKAAELDGDATAAADAATRAAASFAAQQRPAWQALAEAVVLRTTGAGAGPLLDLARRLAADGWSAESVDTALLAGRRALDQGDDELARRALTLAAAAGRDHPLAAVRSAGWHAAALLARAGGDRRGALDAARRGVRAALDAAAGLGARELRASSAVAGAGAAALGLELALEDGTPAQVFTWAERWRAASLAAPPVAPPDDPALTAGLDALRRAAAAAEEASLAGDDAADALQAVARAERRVVRRARLAAGSAADQAEPRLADLRPALGDRVLVELVESDDRLHAVRVDAGRARVVDLGPAAPVFDAVRSLRFAAGRALQPGRAARSLEAANAAVEAGAAELDRLLLAPLDLGRDRPLVVVPTGALHALPWALLPSLRGRPVAVAPSARQWLRSARHAHAAGTGVLVAGAPGVEGVDDELAAVAAAHPAADVLAGATVRAVLDGLAGRRVAHLAAHGTVRADSPMFSSLRFADGPLTVHDLDRTRSAPAVAVLSACDVGRNDVGPGDEVVGLVAALLSLGTTALVASVLPVPHDVAARVTVAFHRHLAAGADPAQALARASEDEPRSPFVCFGGP